MLRPTSIGTGILLIAATTWAANPRDAEPSEDRQNIAQQYAQYLFNLSRDVANQYVQPVDRIDLIEAGLQGLFSAAREPFPVWIRPALQRGKDDPSEIFRIITEARLLIRSAELDPIERSLIATMQGLPRVLDPYCGLVKATEFRTDFDAFATGLGFELGGITFTSAAATRRQATGLMPNVEGLPVPWRIGQVVPGSPAQRAGLRPGDLITHVNRTAITNDNAAEWFAVLRPILNDDNPSTNNEFRLTIRRPPDERSREIELVRMAYQAESVFGVKRLQNQQWNYWLDAENRIGYVRIGAIDRQTSEQLTAAMQQLEDGGIRGLILDLRWCPGGLLTGAVQVAEVFMHEGLIASTKYRNIEFQSEREFRAGNNGLPTFHAGNYPLVVLVNGDTTGGGELIAAALQDNKRARIVGQRTRGKASVQTAMDLPIPNVSFKITTGTFQRPSGKTIQRFPTSRNQDPWGIQPESGDALPMTADLSQRLKEWYDAMALRPGDSREALPLDDPSADPQRDAARRRLLK